MDRKDSRDGTSTKGKFKKIMKKICNEGNIVNIYFIFMFSRNIVNI